MRAQLTEHYVLVETDDIDFSTLRLAVESLPELVEKLAIEIVEESHDDKRLPC